MSREIRQLHRQQNTFSNFSNSESDQSIQQNSDDLDSSPRRRRKRRSDSRADEQPKEQLSPVESIPPVPSSLQNNISSVRAELIDDNHHSSLAPSDFSDDIYDWSNDSSDYDHFLASFE